jgi:hypothetical protein
MNRRRWLRLGGISRDTVLFIAGLGGIAHETLLSNGVERPTLLFLFGAMCGLPLFLRADERSRGGEPKGPDKEGKDR